MVPRMLSAISERWRVLQWTRNPRWFADKPLERKVGARKRPGLHRSNAEALGP